MTKKFALILIGLLVGYIALSAISANNGFSATINGYRLPTPVDALSGAFGIAVAIIVMFFVGILLVCIFAGVGMILVGVFAMVLFILAAAALPFMIPLLLPLLVIWLFCCILKAAFKTPKRV
ncbi:MAG: hypothetical protein JW912_02730 [Sedimentisphaerales bacterium]|nr:hypothetical protein [Sedimentisphaerales bacterium]